MRVKQELPVDVSISRAAIAAGKCRHDTLDSPQSDVAEKYALLLKYSDKARAAELRLSSLPDDLRERFKREAVADPGQIAEIAARLVAEEQKRRSPFGDPKLDTLYRNLRSYGPGAQSEFRQVLELLKGEVDPERVFAQITSREPDGVDRLSSNWEAPTVVRLIETPGVREERRRRAEKIASEIENLRRVSEGLYLSNGTEAPENVKLSRKSAAKSNCPGEAVEPATASGDRPVVAFSDVMPNESAAEPATVPTAALPAMPQPRTLPVASISGKPLKWAPSLAAAAVVVAVMSGAGLALMFPPTGAADRTHRHAVADAPRPTVQEEGALREAAAQAAEAEAASLKVAGEKARAGEVEKKAAEQKLAAEAEARREEEARQARLEEDKVQFEAARQMAGADGRAAAQEVERRQATEDARRAADAAASKTAESRPKPEADARQRAEKAEAGLNLSEQDRKRVQVALTALGHQTPATGYFGPITRAMIANWQKTQGLPPSGFLDSSQLAALYLQAAPAAFDAGQNKIDAQRAEAGLNLSEQDRKRVQVALTALGHQTPATGYFGPITRAMIANWQKTQGLPPSGFLDSSQLAALYLQAAPSLAIYDQRKSPEPRGAM